MKNLLIIIKILLLSFVVAQKPIDNKTSVDSFVKDSNKTRDSIAYVLNKNSKDIEEVKTINLKNDEALANLKKLEIEKKQLMKSNLKLVDILIKMKLVKEKPLEKKKIIYTKNNNIEKNNIILDSTCISYVRNSIFSKKKCDKWEYFKYTK